MRSFCRLGRRPSDHHVEGKFLVTCHQHCSGHYKTNGYLNTPRTLLLCSIYFSVGKDELHNQSVLLLEGKMTMIIIQSFLLKYGTQEMKTTYVQLWCRPKGVSFLKHLIICQYQKIIKPQSTSSRYSMKVPSNAAVH